MELSLQAIIDLRKTLDQTFETGFSLKLSDSEVNEIGLLLLTVLAEGLKQKVKTSQTI